MGIFLKWMALRETNSRKRAVQAALDGRRPPLPGSSATNPETNVRAMKIADKTGLVQKESVKPDYSLDKWLDSIDSIGKNIEGFEDYVNKIEKEVEKETDKKKKDLKSWSKDQPSKQEDKPEKPESSEKKKDQPSKQEDEPEKEKEYSDNS